MSGLSGGTAIHVDDGLLATTLFWGLQRTVVTNLP